jgi:hypothetical protein
MEKIMGESNVTSRDELTIDELDAVSGGSDSAAFRGRYQLRLAEANGLLSAQGSPSPPSQGSG